MMYQRTILSLLVVGSLAACGGSSDSSSDQQAITKSLTGKVADGYLQNATVCLDLSENKLCDIGEPSATSAEGGEFTLEGATQAQIDQFPLLVKVIKGQTIDEDNPGVVLTKSYSLSAPAGYTFVSPLTTMVQNEVEKGSTAEEAKVVVQGKLGTTLNLADDYIAGKTDGTASEEEKAEFSKLHQVAQVAATVIANNMDTLETIATESDIAVDELISLIINEVFDTLDKISVQVDAIGADSSIAFDPVSLATEIDNEFIAIDSATLKEKVAENNASNAATKASLVDVLKSTGINWFWGEKEADVVWLDYGIITLNSDASVTENVYILNELQDAFIVDNAPKLSNDLVLTATGWVVRNDTIERITANSDGTVNFHMVTSEIDEVVTGNEVSLAGLNVQTILRKTGGDGQWATLVPASLTFPANTKGYKLSFSKIVTYEFNKGDWCETGDVDRWNALNQTCNAVFLNGGWATTLESLIATPAVAPYDYLPSVSAVIGLTDGNVVTEMVAGGIVNLYIQLYSGTATKLASGSWTDITVHGQTLREITIPSSVAKIAGQTWTNVNDDNKLYLAVYDGFVRVTHAKNSDGSAEYVFDKVTQEFILNNSDLSLLPPVVPQ